MKRNGRLSINPQGVEGVIDDMRRLRGRVVRILVRPVRPGIGLRRANVERGGNLAGHRLAAARHLEAKGVTPVRDAFPRQLGLGRDRVWPARDIPGIRDRPGRPLDIRRSRRRRPAWPHSLVDADRAEKAHFARHVFIGAKIAGRALRPRLPGMVVLQVRRQRRVDRRRTRREPVVAGRGIPKRIGRHQAVGRAHVLLVEEIPLAGAACQAHAAGARPAVAEDDAIADGPARNRHPGATVLIGRRDVAGDRVELEDASLDAGARRGAPVRVGADERVAHRAARLVEA